MFLNYNHQTDQLSADEYRIPGGVCCAEDDIVDFCDDVMIGRSSTMALTDALAARLALEDGRILHNLTQTVVERVHSLVQGEE